MNKITTNPNRIDLDEAYLQMAEIWGRRSKANRLQVGCLIVKNRQIISDGYNGMPAGSADDTCEVFVNGVNINDGLRTKRDVLHAESNALLKIAENGGTGTQGATLYTTWSPCFDCAKLIRQAKIARVVFRSVYRDMDGLQFLQDSGVQVEQLPASTEQEPVLSRTSQPQTPTLAVTAVTAVTAAPKQTVSTKPAAPPTPPRSFSMLQAVTGVQDEVSRLRAMVPPPPTGPETEPEPAIGKTDFVPLVSDDEVAALLKAHEETARAEAAGTQIKPAAIAEGPYHSTFF